MTFTPRARTYELLGKLLLADNQAIERARKMAPLSEHLAALGTSEVAAAHFSIFGQGAFPYAGVYTEKEALIGGHIAERVAELAAATNVPLRADESPDHVGNIALLASHLLRRGDHETAHAVVAGCLVPWLAPWASAALRHGTGFWPFVVELFVELVVDHIGEEVEGFELALARPLAPDDHTGVGAIASALTTPSIAGALLTREDIRRIGRALELPTGFGNRRLMLTNLLRSAAEYHAASALLAELAAYFRGYRDREPPAALVRLGAAWRQRAEKTAVCLDGMNIELAGAVATVG